MSRTVFVKVVGFRDVERHALNTVFRLSTEYPVCYALWTPESPVMPHIALIDVDSYEAGMALESPSLNPSLKLICIGEGAPERAWRTFPRPINWRAILHVMDQLFAPKNVDIPIDDDSHGEAPSTLAPPGMRRTLIVDPTREDRLYLRARLALAGLIEVDEAESIAEAQVKAREIAYDIAIVNVDGADDPWSFVSRLLTASPPVGSVVVTTINRSWQMHERAEQAGCRAVIDKPFDPTHVFRVLQMI